MSIPPHPLDSTGVLQAAKVGDWTAFRASLVQHKDVLTQHQHLNELPPGRWFGVLHQIAYHRNADALAFVIQHYPRFNLKLLTKDGRTALEVALDKPGVAEDAFFRYYKERYTIQTHHELANKARAGDWDSLFKQLEEETKHDANQPLTPNPFPLETLNSVPPGRSWGILHQIAFWGNATALEILLLTFPGLDLELETNEEPPQHPIDIARGRGHTEFVAKLTASLQATATATASEQDPSNSNPPPAKRAKTTNNDNTPATEDGSCLCWTNPQELAFVLRLGDLWNVQIPLRITLSKNGATTNVAIAPVTREDWESIEENTGDIDEEEDFYDEDGDYSAVADKCLEYFRSFYHMNQERGQKKIFGHGWKGTVLESVQDLLERLEQGREAVFYVSDLPICDEFSCSEKGPVAEAVQLLRNLIYQKHWVTQDIYGGTDYQNRQIEKPTLSFDNLLGEGTKIQVTGSGESFRVRGVASEQELQRLAEFLHPPLQPQPPQPVITDPNFLFAHLMPQPMLVPIVPPPPNAGPPDPALLGQYQPERPHSSVFGGSSAGADPSLQRLYQRLAYCSQVYLCQRTRDLVKETGIVAASEIQAYLYDYVGEFQAVVFSACDINGEQQPQTRFKQPSWSAHYNKGNPKAAETDTTGNKTSLTATVTQLRDVGILDFETNELSRSNLVVVLEEEEQSLYKAVEHDPSKVSSNALPANGVVA